MPHKISPAILTMYFFPSHHSCQHHLPPPAGGCQACAVRSTDGGSGLIHAAINEGTVWKRSRASEGQDGAKVVKRCQIISMESEK